MTQWYQNLEMPFDPETLAPVGDGGAEERVLREIVEMELQQQAWELDTNGYTILSPSQVAPPGFFEKLRELILREAAAVNGIEADVVTGNTHSKMITPTGRGQFLPDILFKDRIFEQAMMMRPILALVTYLVGESCTMTGMNAVIKGPGPECFPLHVDTPQPAPLPPYAQGANATWILSNYTIETGPTVFVPGSHKWCRNPLGKESIDFSRAIPLEAAAGSVVIWHGNTWHGSIPMTAPGLRISLITYFARYYTRPPSAGAYSARVTQEMLDRNPPRFGRLTDRQPVAPAHEYACRISQYA